MEDLIKTNQNIYVKLSEMRVDLQKKGLQKTGENLHSHFKYYEMDDFLPYCNEIAAVHKTLFIYEMREKDAILKLINCENVEEQLVFIIPIAVASVPGASAIQNIGALATYTRRYLYMIAWEISEKDDCDSTDASEKRVAEEKEQSDKATEEKKRLDYEKKQLEIAKKSIGEAKLITIRKELARTGVTEQALSERFKVNSIIEITEGIFGVVMKALRDTKTKDGFKED